MIFFFMYKPHYCFMREACPFACFEQNASAEMYPLHYMLCSVTGRRGYVGKDRCGLCPRCRAAHITSLPAWSQADQQQLCTSGAIPPARHSHLSQRPAPSAPPFPKREAVLTWGYLESPPLLPGQLEHCCGEYGALHRPREMIEGLGLFTGLTDG